MKEFLKNHKLLKSVDLDRLIYTEKKYADKSIIKLAGTPNQYLALVYKGEAIMQHIGIDGQTMVVASFSEGSTFGGNRLFCENNAFPLTIFAKGETTIIYIEKDQVLNLCQCDKNFLIEYLKDVADKSDILSKKIKSATFVTLEEQIINYLKRQAASSKSLEFDMTISKKEWAEELGIQRTSLSRALQRMKQKGWLLYKNHHYVLLNNEIFKHP